VDELWACSTMAWGKSGWYPGGRQPAPGERQALNAGIMQRFPFVEGAAPLTPKVDVLPSQEVL
jgi:hypothetical protein